ncbi:hypothetical protein KC19_8G064000 [Ceratodon purpureus]|uniref:Protein kinase domain-containing protein n=1 Tax=Ceratodon purpureus TaxID=3225 RepID=A0A8T0GW07_CERPU|nr:hypothetical protein KC19_8G064000 [Ceratodon purpureus]
MRMEQKKNLGPPFPFEKAREFMWYIAFWMQGLLKRDILHRDVKASNVLISTEQDLRKFDPEFGNAFIYVADFECSMGVLGTTFWRTPEILLSLRDRNTTLELYTEKTDVYSYAMTCYEIVTGRIPFEGRSPSNYNIVLSGQRPKLPNDLDSRVKELIMRCWHQDPIQRPTFTEVIKFWKNWK